MRALIITAVITSVSISAFFTPANNGLAADRVVAQIAAVPGQELE